MKRIGGEWKELENGMEKRIEEWRISIARPEDLHMAREVRVHRPHGLPSRQGTKGFCGSVVWLVE